MQDARCGGNACREGRRAEGLTRRLAKERQRRKEGKMERVQKSPFTMGR